MVENRYTVAVYKVYYKPILKLILVVAQWFSNIFSSVPIDPGSKYQKSKIHWSMPNVGGVLGANFAKFALTDFAQKRLNRFHKKSPTAPEPLIMGGQFLHRKL